MPHESYVFLKHRQAQPLGPIKECLIVVLPVELTTKPLAAGG